MGCAWVGEDPCTNGDGLPRACCDVGNARPAEHRLCDVHVGHTGHQPCLLREETLAGERNAKETGFRWVQVEGGCERPVPANLLAWLKPVGCSQDRPPTQPQSAGPAAVGRADLRTAGFAIEKETAFRL